MKKKNEEREGSKRRKRINEKGSAHSWKGREK